MSNKAARRRNREQRRLRALASPAPDPGYVACAAADLASIDSQLDDACDALRELAGTAASVREGWPATAETDELRAVFEAVRQVAAECRTRLAAAGDRVLRLRETQDHLHVAGTRVVRLVPVVDDASDPDDDLPF